MASGYRIPGVQPGPAFPLAGKANLVDSSEKQGEGPDGAGLPKAIVDEIELFTAGAIGTRASYLVEQYVVDGGMPGLTRDAWITDRVNPWQARIPVYVQGGSFTLPLPVDPETFRDSYQGYTLYEQTVGANSFNFFDPKIGVRLSVGNPLRGLNGQVFAGPGHDRQSGLATNGTDTMGFAQDAIGPLTLSAYRYEGTRPDRYRQGQLLAHRLRPRLQPVGASFERNGPADRLGLELRHCWLFRLRVERRLSPNYAINSIGNSTCSGVTRGPTTPPTASRATPWLC